MEFTSGNLVGIDPDGDVALLAVLERSRKRRSGVGSLALGLGIPPIRQTAS
jgi:hypothetical protein